MALAETGEGAECTEGQKQAKVLDESQWSKVATVESMALRDVSVLGYAEASSMPWPKRI